MELFLLAWAAQAAFGIGVMVMNPKRDDLSERVQKFRKAAIQAGFFPWVGVMFAVQVVALIAYRASIAIVEPKRQELQAQLQTSFDIDITDSGVQQATQASSATSNNPFL